MRQLVLYAQWTGYVTWFCVAWAIIGKAVTITDRVVSERRRWRNARRLAFWRPVPRPRDPGNDLTRVLPAIQRPRKPLGTPKWNSADSIAAGAALNSPVTAGPMARDHARVYHRIWADRDFRALSEAAQRAYVLVMTQPDLNYCGVTTLAMHRWSCLAADSTPRRVRKAIGELETARFVATDTITEELLIRSFVRNDGLLSSPNICINVVRTYPSVLSPRLRLLFLIELHRLNQEEQEPGWEKGWAHLTPLLSEPIPEGLPEGFTEGLPEPIPKGLRLAHARHVRRGSGPAPDPVLHARAREDGADATDPTAWGAAEARRLLAEKEGTKERTAL